MKKTILFVLLAFAALVWAQQTFDLVPPTDLAGLHIQGATTTTGAVVLTPGTPQAGPNQALSIGAIGTGKTTLGAVSGTLSNYIDFNYVTDGGANNAITANITDALGNNVALVAGLRACVQLAHTLQAGANTFTINGGSAKNIKSHFNVANNIGTAYAATGLWCGTYDGTEWVDLSE